MARIKHIDPQELALLRDRIIERFAQRNPTETLPPLNAYLPNYEELKDDIVESVPGINGSVSENRLRKLFYYTNPSCVDPGQLKSPNFGIDFLDACYRYISSDMADRRTFQINSDSDGQKSVRLARLIGLSALIIVPTLIIWALTSRSDDNDLSSFEPFIEQFEQSGPKDLEGNGWLFMDANEFAKRQSRPGYVTFYTLPGSYWVKPGEPKMMPNMLMHTIPDQSVGIRACFEAFYPDQRWQAAGLVLFDKNMDRNDVMILAYGFTGKEDPDQESDLMYSAYRLIAGTPDIPFFSTFAHPELSDGDALRFEVRYADSNVDFKIGVNDDWGFTQEWEPTRSIGTMKKPFEPAYVGFFAVQGWTDDDRQPMNADTIPVYLNWVEFY